MFRNAEPLAAFFVRARRRFGEAFEPQALLAHWASRSVGTLVGPDRYRWELTHKRGTGIPQYAGAPATWQAWRASEAALVQGEAFAFEELLLGPVVTRVPREVWRGGFAGLGARRSRPLPRSGVLAAREELGRAIGELKTVECHPKLGILRRVELGA